jgi:hypothetical protein
MPRSGQLPLAITPAIGHPSGRQVPFLLQGQCSKLTLLPVPKWFERRVRSEVIMGSAHLTKMDAPVSTAGRSRNDA